VSAGILLAGEPAGLVASPADGKQRTLDEAMRCVGADEVWLACHYKNTADVLGNQKEPTKLLLEALRECAKNLETEPGVGKSSGPNVLKFVHCVSRPQLFSRKEKPPETVTDTDVTAVAETA
jgi:hypothetical protein